MGRSTGTAHSDGTVTSRVTALFVLVILFGRAPIAHSQTLAERPPANAQRAADVKATAHNSPENTRLCGLLQPSIAPRSRQLCRCLDIAVAEAKRVIGHREWQRNGDKKITYYLFLGTASSSSDGEAFIRAAFVKEAGRAPWPVWPCRNCWCRERRFSIGHTDDRP
jgi:hypothetical protein